MASTARSLFADIGTNSLRYLEVSRGPAEWIVHAGGKISLDGMGKGKIGEALKQKLNPQGAVFDTIGASIWTSTIFVRRITMPLMTPQELKGALAFEAEKHVPYPINECAMDSVIVRKMQGSKQMELMLIVAKKDLINERRLMMEEAGLGLGFVDIHPFALANAFAACAAPAAGQATTFLHIGDIEKFSFAGANFVSIMKDGQPQLVRDLGQETSPANEAKISTEAMEKLSEKIKSSIEFYENSAEEEINEVFIGGQGAYADDALKFIEQSTEKKIKTFSFLDKVKFESKEAEETVRKQEREYLVCMGLAVRGLKS